MLSTRRSTKHASDRRVRSRVFHLFWVYIGRTQLIPAFGFSRRFTALVFKIQFAQGKRRY